MKRIICLMLIFAIMLTSCSNQSANMSSENSSESISEPEEQKISIENEEEIRRDISNEECIDWNTGISYLYRLGISHAVKNINIVDDWYWNAELVLRKGENKLVLPIEGLYYYSGDEIKAPYGAFEIYDDYIAYVGKEKVVFFDKESLEVQSFTPELNKRGFYDIWVNAAIFDEVSGNYILLTTALNKKDTVERSVFVNVYSKDGTAISTKETSILCFSYYANTDYVFPSCKMNPCRMVYYEDSTFLEYYDKLINIETGESFYYSELETFAKEDYMLKLYAYRKTEDDKSKYAAFLYKNDKRQDVLFFEESDLSIYYNETDEPSGEISFDGEKVIYYSEFYAMTLELDFKNKTHSVRYEPEERHISEIVEESSDGKYSIGIFAATGRGDVWYNRLAVKNNDTGKYHYIGKAGGMYGGYGGYGFLKNDDIYNYSLDMLKIFDSETGELKFDITKNFPLGFSKDEKQGRGIFTFRRDPNDFSYIVVCYEFDDGYSWEEVLDENGRFLCYKANYNYKIGFLDSDGRLLESYDTGFSVLCDTFGFHKVQMRYSEEKLTLFFDGPGKAFSKFSGEFDRQTKEFTVL